MGWWLGDGGVYWVVLVVFAFLVVVVEFVNVVVVELIFVVGLGTETFFMLIVLICKLLTICLTILAEIRSLLDLYWTDKSPKCSFTTSKLMI